MILFIFGGLCRVFVAVHRLSLGVVGEGYILVELCRFSLQWLLLLQSVGSRVHRLQLPHSIWNIPGPEIKPVSHALAGGFLTTGPLGSPIRYT